MSQILIPEKTNEPLTFQLDISGHVENLPGEASMAVNLYLPSQEALQSATPRTLITLVHGASYTRRYWDLTVPGYAREAYSLAHYLAKQGHVVLTLDNLGMGESHVTLNGFDLTTTMMAQALVVTTTIVKQRLSDGTLLAEPPFAIGLSMLVGHSMGGYLSTLAQAKFQVFDAVVIQGIGAYLALIAGLDMEMMQHLLVADARGYINIPREVFHAFFHGSFPPPPEVIREDDKYGVTTPATLFIEVYQESHLLIERVSNIRVPVLLTFGEEDLTVDPMKELMLYTNVPSRSLYIHRGSAHCNNFAPTRTDFWQVLAQFVPWVQALSSPR